jgi:hypothetical protein
MDFSVPANAAQLIGQLPEAVQPEMWQLQWTLARGVTGENHYLAGKPPVTLAQYRNWLEQLFRKN